MQNTLFQSIPSAPDHIRAMHQEALEIPKNPYIIPDAHMPWPTDQATLDAIALEQHRRKLWRTVLQYAEATAEVINDHSPRDLNAFDILDHWYLDLDTQSSTGRDVRSDDRITGFLTIGQELKELEEQENAQRYAYWESLYREWWFGGKQGPKPRCPQKVHYSIVEHRDHDRFGKAAWEEQEDEILSLSELRERRSDIRQDAMDDPENPYEDSQGRRRLTVRHLSRHGESYTFLSYRGQKGVMGGIYVDTDPEPTARSPKGRKTLLKALKNSDSQFEVEMAIGMNKKFRKKGPIGPSGKHRMLPAFDPALRAHKNAKKLNLNTK